MSKLKPNTVSVINFLKEHADQDLTAADVAEALSLEKRQVDGIFTSAIQRKGYGLREEAEVTLADDSHKRVKFLRLTAEGMALDPDAEE